MSEIDPIGAARQWKQTLAEQQDERDRSVSFVISALLEIIDGYQTEEMCAGQRLAYPTTSHFTVEIFQPFGAWEQASNGRSTLEAACTRMEQLRQRWPDCRFRIIRWDKMATVVMEDPDPGQPEARTPCTSS